MIELVSSSTSVAVICPACSQGILIPLRLEEGGLTEDGDLIVRLIPDMDAIDRHNHAEEGGDK